jgi:hypothetical protein
MQGTTPLGDLAGHRQWGRADPARGEQAERDCASHDVIATSDDLLWLHMRAGVTLFRRPLLDEFAQDLADLLHSRVIRSAQHRRTICPCWWSRRSGRSLP